MSLIPTFAEPFWLLIGCVCCVAVLFFLLLNTRRRKKELEKFVAPKLLRGLTGNVSRSRRRMKNIVFVLGLAFLFLALARPQYGERWIEVRRKGIDILIGVDVSKSMLVQDIKPSRLERSKLAIRDFVAKLEGDRVGLLPFAGSAFLMCPLTTDYDAFTASLDTLDVNSIPKGGTDIGAAIRQGAEILSNETNHKILVLVTDGEDLSEDALKAAEEAKGHNMTVYALGVGTPEGELVPTSEGQIGRFVKDEQGNFITSRLDEQTLTSLAETTSGLYVPLGNMGQGFDVIYERKLSLIPQEEHGQRRRKIPIERFPWPVAMSVLFLGVEFLLSGRKSDLALRLPFVKTAGRRKKRSTTGVRLGLAITALATLATLSGVLLPQAQASEGEELFHAGDYAGAAAYYQKKLENEKSDPALYFNLGGALYRQEKYEQAAGAFTQALLTDDLSLQARSYYNRGNSQFFLGASSAGKDKEQALNLWNEAKKSFESALKLEPEDKAAAHNLEMVKKKMDQLKEQMNQSGQQSDKPQEGKEGEQKKDEKQQGSEQQKNQGEQGEQGEQSGSPDEKDDAGQQDQEAAEQQEKKEKQQHDAEQNAASEAEQDKETPTAEDIQKAATAQDKQGEKPDKDKQMSAEDIERRMMGKMTEEEAKNLLDSLKEEQGELNFLPQGGNNDSVDKDW